MELIIKGRSALHLKSTTPASEEVERLYKELWSEEGRCDQQFHGAPVEDPLSLMAAFGFIEVKYRFIRVESAAKPGPGGLRKEI